jgi:predicted nucleic acid-binding protein
VTVAYFDSSALVKMLLAEEGREVSLALWDAADAAATSRLAYPEVRAGLAAAYRGRRLDAESYADAKAEWRLLWSQLRLVDAAPHVLDAAGELAEACALRGFDAVHLASALRLGSPSGGDGPIMVAWDDRLRWAAAGFGLRTAPVGSGLAGGGAAAGGSAGGE